MLWGGRRARRSMILRVVWGLSDVLMRERVGVVGGFGWMRACRFGGSKRLFWIWRGFGTIACQGKLLDSQETALKRRVGLYVMLCLHRDQPRGGKEGVFLLAGT